ncbi:MAG: hypothetical protein QM701_20015 [Propionivibrio sp.]
MSFDFLEAVDVEIDQRQPPLVPPRLRDRQVQAVGEQHAVRHAGQRVVVRHAFEPLLVLLQLGDVRNERDVVQRGVDHVLHGGDAQPFRVEPAVLVPVPHFAFPVPARDQLAPHGAVEILALAPRLEKARVLPDGFLARVAGDAAEGGVDVDDVALGVGDHDALVGVREDAGRQFQAGFARLVLGNVGEGEDAADDQFAQFRRPRLAFEVASVVERQQVVGLLVAVRPDFLQAPPVRLRIAHAGRQEIEHGVVVAGQQRFVGNLPDAGELAVHVDDRPAAVEQQDAVRGRLERGAQPRAGVGQLVLGAVQLAGRDGADDQRTGVRGRPDDGLGRAQQLAVGAQVRGVGVVDLRHRALADVLPIEDVGERAFDVGDRPADQLVPRVAQVPRRRAVGRADFLRRQVDQQHDFVAVLEQEFADVVGSHAFPLLSGRASLSKK